MNALAELISRAGCQFAEREALIDGSRALSFSQVEADTNRLASALSHGVGLTKGVRVAILLPNCAEFVLTDFALIKAGLIRVPVNPRFIGAEIEFILSHSGAAALITCEAYASTLAGILPSLGKLRQVITVDALPGVAGALHWSELLRQGATEAFAVDTSESDGYMLGYTSGTTGRPKGALTSVRSRWAMLFNTFANEMFVSSGDVMLHVASLAHGSGTKVLPLFVKGAKTVLMPKFSTAEFFRLVEKHKVSISWMVPTIVAMLADSAERKQHNLASLTTIIYGGAPMPEPVVERALAAFGPIFVQIYGLTEAPQPDLVLAKEDHLADPLTGKRRGAGAAGRLATGVRMRLVDDAGGDVAPGEVGEIIIAGAHIMTEYWNDPEASAQTLRGGWCHTGDLARTDADGFFYIVDRKKEMIITGGYNVYPREVEDVLYQHAAVEECAVVAASDETWGETVHAVIVLKPGLEVNAEAIVSHCARSLAGYKKPRKVTFLAELPKTANGKIDKKVLRARFAAATTDQRLSGVAA